MRRSSLAFMFVAGLSVGVVPILLMMWSLSTQANQARASEARLAALLQREATQSPLPASADPHPGFSPIDPPSALAPAAANPPLVSQEPPLPSLDPQPISPDSARVSSAPPENEAEEFVDKTHDSLQKRFEQLQVEKKTLQVRLQKIEKYSRLIKTLLAALEEKEGDVPLREPEERTVFPPEPARELPERQDLVPPANAPETSLPPEPR